MTELHDILRRPLITEKSNLAKEGANQITFEVASWANKVQIRQAVEEVFKVNVRQVRTLTVGGKVVKRWGRKVGHKPDWKKAVVTLAPGQKIEFFEGA